MKRIILILLTTLILTGMSLAQLREFKIEPAPKPEDIPLFRNETDNAVVYIYSSLDNLAITSNFGIKDDRSRPKEGIYKFSIIAAKQFLTVKAPGFKEGKIEIPKSVKAKDRLFFMVEELILDGVLIVNSIPGNAEVWINGQPFGSGRTPVSDTLKAGDYELVLKKTPFEDIIKEITVEAEKETQYALKFKFGSLSLESTPPGAEVFLDGNKIGETGSLPLEVNHIPTGVHSVYVRKEFYRDVTKNFTVVDGQVTSDNIILPKTQAALNLEKRLRWKKFRTATIGAATVSGLSGLGLKFLSDSKYEEYNNATSTADATDLRKQVENYDLYTTIAYTGCAVFAGWSLFNHLIVVKTPVPEKLLKVSINPTPTGVVASINF